MAGTFNHYHYLTPAITTPSLSLLSLSTVFISFSQSLSIFFFQTPKTQRQSSHAPAASSFSSDPPLFNYASAMADGVPFSPMFTLAKQTYCCKDTMVRIHVMPSRSLIVFFPRMLPCSLLW
ncbi:hypothetical protein Q3G72_013494 [Acer saccharum]|nr:hypothetical protein Q3G72_013494 [Acer saccharum]